MTAHAAEALDMTTIDGIQKCIEFVPGDGPTTTPKSLLSTQSFDVYKQLFAFGYDGLRPSKAG
jgi:hypothetical protein